LQKIVSSCHPSCVEKVVSGTQTTLDEVSLLGSMFCQYHRVSLSAPLVSCLTLDHLQVGSRRLQDSFYWLFGLLLKPY